MGLRSANLNISWACWLCSSNPASLRRFSHLRLFARPVLSLPLEADIEKGHNARHCGLSFLMETACFSPVLLQPGPRLLSIFSLNFRQILQCLFGDQAPAFLVDDFQPAQCQNDSRYGHERPRKVAKNFGHSQAADGKKSQDQQLRDRKSVV